MFTVLHKGPKYESEKSGIVAIVDSDHGCEMLPESLQHVKSALLEGRASCAHSRHTQYSSFLHTRGDVFMQRTHNRFYMMQSSSADVGFASDFFELTTVLQGLPLSRKSLRTLNWRRPTITWGTS